MFTNCKTKAHIYSLVERVILNFGEGADSFEDNVFDCSLLYFSSSLSSLSVSLTNPEKPSARVGGGAVRQSRLPWRIPGLSRSHRLLPVPQGSHSPALAPHPRAGLSGRVRTVVCPPGLPRSQLGCHSTVTLKENGIVAPGEQDSASLGETGCREKGMGANEVPCARASAQWGHWMYTWGNGTWQLEPQL